MRGLAREERLGGVRVRVGSSSTDTELVLVEPDAPTWARAVESVAGEPRAMLTVVGARPAAYVEDVPPGVRLDREDETLMTRRLEPVASSPVPVPDGSDLDVDDEPTRHTVRLVRERRVVSAGAVGVHGRVATYDAVETLQNHRRQGLARWVLTELDRYAVAAGARDGILVATADGSGLYRSVGWETAAGLRSLRGT